VDYADPLLPPHSDDAERSVLGGLLLAPWAWDQIDFLRASYFYVSQHRRIYSAIESLVDRGQQVDALTVQDALGSDGEERAYIGGLAISLPSVTHIRRYAEIVRDRWLLREVQRTATEAASAAYGVGADAKAIAEAAEAGFLSILTDQRGGEEIGFDEAVRRAVEIMETPAEAAIPTGLHNVDRMLKGGGLRPGQLVIIAGRPSMGKSALAGQICERVSEAGMVALFTLEMGAAEVAERSVTYHASLQDRDAAALHCMKFKVRVDDTPAVTLAHVRLRSTRMKRKYGLVMIVVDYLQLMESKGDNREQEIARLSRGLKALAKSLHVPVIAVSQLNRGVENRQDKRPALSDLRESGQLEQDADVVMMLYRHDYYEPSTPFRGVTECAIKKQRGGATGTALLMFQPEVTRFHDYQGPYATTDSAPKGGKVVTPDFKSRAAGE